MKRKVNVILYDNDKTKLKYRTQSVNNDESGIQIDIGNHSITVNTGKKPNIEVWTTLPNGDLDQLLQEIPIKNFKWKHKK